MNPNFKDHFSQLAAMYADCRPHYPSTLFDFLTTLVPQTAWVWDCAAGSGQATIDLAGRFDRVIATDASSQQIESAPRHARVEYRVAKAEESGLPDRSVGLITVAQALHWFDLRQFYAEVVRVLASQGVLAVWAYGINQVEGDTVNAIVQHYYHKIVGPYWPPERQLVEEGYRSISFPFETVKSPEFHMEAGWGLDQLVGYFSTWSATNRYRKATGKDPLAPLRAELEKAWGDPAVPRKVVWPLALRLGKVRCPS